MNKKGLLVSDFYTSKEIENFLENIKARKCIYYASDVLNLRDQDLANLEMYVYHAIEIFRTLDIPADNHFYSIFRYNRSFIYKDWRLSKLACIYLPMMGDPTDISLIAQQQTYLIDRMLHFIHEKRQRQITLNR